EQDHFVRAALDGGRRILEARDAVIARRLHAAGIQILDEIRRLLRGHDRYRERLIDRRHGLRDDDVDEHRKQHGPEERAEDEGRKQRAPVARIVDELLATYGPRRPHRPPPPTASTKIS